MLLPIGTFVASYLGTITRHRYDNSGFLGEFYGFVRGSLSCSEPQFYFCFEGKSKPEWRWCRPNNYRYSKLSLQWESGQKKGTATLDLPSLTVYTENSTEILTKPTLLFWLTGKASAKEKLHCAIDKLYALLVAADQGTLPSPRHHHYHSSEILGKDDYKEPFLCCDLIHYSLGLRISHTVPVWIIMWLILVVGAVCNLFHKSSPK